MRTPRASWLVIVACGSLLAAACKRSEPRPEVTTHAGGGASTLAVDRIPAPAEREVGIDRPGYAHCGPKLSAVEGRYVVFVRDGQDTEAVAKDLSARVGIQVRHVWPMLSSFSADMTHAQLSELLEDTRLHDVSDDCKG